MRFWAEIELEVDYDYQPEERAVYYPNDHAYPGCPAYAVPTDAKFVFGKKLVPVPEEFFDWFTETFEDELNTEMMEDAQMESMEREISRAEWMEDR